MRYFGPVFKAEIGIRGRILSIALAPSLALLVTGAIIVGLLLIRGTDNQDWATRVDHDSAPGIVDFFERRGMPFIVGVNCFDGGPQYSIAEVRQALDLDDHVPVQLCDVRGRDSAKDVLVQRWPRGHWRRCRSSGNAPGLRS
ncbi:hypothetical protein ACW2Q0_20630 [Nocardia sp. R16R-3T]